jgi:hypothetical protein
VPGRWRFRPRPRRPAALVDPPGHRRRPGWQRRRRRRRPDHRARCHPCCGGRY